MDTGSKKIARVFPRRTSATPHDELAFVGAITMETIAAIARAEPSEIHISATFTWDLPDVDELYESYSVFGVPVEVGGPPSAIGWATLCRGCTSGRALCSRRGDATKTAGFAASRNAVTEKLESCRSWTDGTYSMITCWQPLWSTSAACATCSCVSRNAPYFLGDLSRAC